MKGIGFVGMFFFMLVMLGMFSFLYIALDQAEDDFRSFADNNINEQSNIDAITLVGIEWLYLPLAAVFSFIVWGINRARRDRDQLI